MNVSGRTDVGKKRERNEDCFFVSEGQVGIFERLLVLADGMGGHSYGEVAAETAVKTTVQYLSNAPMDFPEAILQDAVAEANLEVHQKADDKHASLMGTTLVIAGIINGYAYVANVGDSRLYIINSIKNTITQITRDHSYVEEMVRVPAPFSTRSSLEKITPSVLVSPSATKASVTLRELSEVVVTKTLSAAFT